MYEDSQEGKNSEENGLSARNVFERWDEVDGKTSRRLLYDSEPGNQYSVGDSEPGTSIVHECTWVVDDRSAMASILEIESSIECRLDLDLIAACIVKTNMSIFLLVHIVETYTCNSDPPPRPRLNSSKYSPIWKNRTRE